MMNVGRVTPGVLAVKPNAGLEKPKEAGEFKELLKQQFKNPTKNPGFEGGLKFSNHAVERMNQRGIRVGPAEINRISQALDKAEKKGAKESLLIMGDSAMIANVKNKTIITAMDKEMLKENVFTNIDSTVFI
jgi:flagellar operon protein